VRTFIAENATTESAVVPPTSQCKMTTTSHAQRHIGIWRPRHNGLLKSCNHTSHAQNKLLLSLIMFTVSVDHNSKKESFSYFHF